MDRARRRGVRGSVGALGQVDNAGPLRYPIRRSGLSHREWDGPSMSVSSVLDVVHGGGRGHRSPIEVRVLVFENWIRELQTSN